MAGIKIVDLPALGRDLINTDLLEVSLNGSGSRKITGQEIMNASKLAVGSTPIVSGTVGRLLFQGTGNVLGQNANLFWNNTPGHLGIGTSSPLGILHLKETAAATRMVMDGDAGQSKIITFRTNGLQRFGFYLNNIAESGGNAGSDFAVRAYNDAGSLLSTPLYIHRDSGNIGVNTTVDSGFKFDVNGTARVVGPTFAVGDWTSRSTSVYVRALTGGSENRGFFIGTGASNDGNVGSFTYQPTGNLLNIRSPYNSGTVALSFEGNTNSTQFHNTSGVVHSKIVSGTGNWLINTTTDAGFKLDVNGTARVSGALTTTGTISAGGSINAGTNLIGNVPNLQGIQPQGGTGEFRFVNGGGTGWFYTWVQNNGVERMRLSTANNLLIGTTTDAGFKLDVNGTARVTGTFSLGADTARIDLWRSSGAGGGRIGTGYTNPSVNHVYITCDTNSRAIVIDDSNRTVFASSLGTSTVASAQVAVVSSTRGFLPPVMTNAQRAAIASPAVGLIVYCTDSTEGLYVYKSTGWTFMV